MYRIVVYINKILTNYDSLNIHSKELYLPVKSILMELSPFKVNLFLFFKLPAAFWCGVRLKKLSYTDSVVCVRHRWINQNPFKSMYFAVQAMAAELSTGALVMSHIKQSGRSISMLVASSQSTFSKKATGKIYFTCSAGEKIKQAIAQTIQTGEGVTVVLESTGVNQQNEQVSIMQFEWTLKLKSNTR